MVGILAGKKLGFPLGLEMECSHQPCLRASLEKRLAAEPIGSGDGRVPLARSGMTTWLFRTTVSIGKWKGRERHARFVGVRCQNVSDEVGQ